MYDASQIAADDKLFAATWRLCWTNPVTPQRQATGTLLVLGFLFRSDAVQPSWIRAVHEWLEYAARACFTVVSGQAQIREWEIAGMV